MNDNEFDLAARAWLDDGPAHMSDRAVLSALEEIHSTRQRRAAWPAWRASPMSAFARLAITAGVVVAIGLVGASVVLRQPDMSGVGGPSPSPTAAQAVEFPVFTATFVSPTNGFSFEYRHRGALERATEAWDPANQPPIDETELGASGAAHWNAFDVAETGLGAVFMGASTEVPDGVAIDGWIDAAVAKYLPAGCYAPRSQQPRIVIDGHVGRITDDCPNEIVATVVAGGRLYLFTLSHSRTDARAWFDAWVTTIDLTPDTAAAP